jgi:transcriptional regulator with XRE-family HTH domain
MSPEDIKALRSELGCSAKDLAGALGLEQAEVLAWERGELFPTKRFVDQMNALRKKGPGAIPKKKRGTPASPLHALADPAVWLLVRKLLAHPELMKEAAKLGEAYPDPAETKP